MILCIIFLFFLYIYSSIQEQHVILYRWLISYIFQHQLETISINMLIILESGTHPNSNSQYFVSTIDYKYKYKL
jgi:hypothetical protein